MEEAKVLVFLALALLSLALEGCNDSSKGPEQRRLGSFLVIGDWGWDSEVHDLESRVCQEAVADAMAEKMRQLGDVKFVINVGDSFYPNGVANKSDPQWDRKFRDVYSSELRSIPWYSVYGNHDYINDPCVCTNELNACGQINDNESDLDFFYMPDFSWFKEHLDLDTEVIAMDTNYYMWLNHTCHYTVCPEACAVNLKKRADAAFALFHDRIARSNASNWLVFSHYPTDYFPGGSWNESMPLEPWSPSWLSMPHDELPDRFHDFLSELSNESRNQIVYFGGHRHNVDQSSTTSTSPQSNWLVGGGGGWGTDGDKQGFVVGEIGANGKVTTYSVLVDFALCS